VRFLFGKGKGENTQGILQTYGKSLIRGLGLSIVLIFAVALLYHFGILGEESFDTAIWVVLILGICFGSIYGAMKIGMKGFIHGAAIGALYILILGLVAFLVDKGQVTLSGFLTRLVMGVVIGALSGMIGMVLNNK
jgi:putative membrane protein (TIGR04086 family)